VQAMCRLDDTDDEHDLDREGDRDADGDPR